MGAAVAGLGSILGGMAAQKIMGTPTTYGPDTSVPGVSSATIKKGGKGKPDEKVPQVDISQSLRWFSEAAAIQTQYYNDGLQYYNKALKAAAVEINAGYKKANETVQPLSFASNQALNEQMRMMGLDPISSSVNAKSHAAELGLGGDIQKMLVDAESMRDPNERKAAKQNILNSIQNNNNTFQSMIDKYDSDITSLAKPDTIVGRGSQFMGMPLRDQYLLSDTDLQKLRNAGMTSNDPNQSNYDSANGGWGTTVVSSAQIAEYNQRMQKEYDTKKAELISQKDALLGKISNYSAFADEYNTSYADEYDDAYTGAEVEARVASTPGYQFQMEQGTKAIERQGAAKGMLGSGNTLTALTNYGQQLAQNFYGMYMDNLSNIVNEGSPATMQISQNQINQGKDYGALIEAGGDAGMQTHQLIGNAQAEQRYRSGQLYADAAMFNASMQNSGIQGAQNRQVQLAQTAMNNQAPNAMANLAQSKFNYGVFQNQQAGAAYAAARTV